jgi:hypothetical protein
MTSVRRGCNPSPRYCRVFLSVALAFAMAVGTGCMSMPDRYSIPLRVFEPGVDSASVYGFEHTEFRSTGSGGGVLMAPSLGIYAVAGGGKGEYTEVSDAWALRYLLEDTRCIRRVDEGGSARIRLEGQSHAEHHYGFVGGLGIFLTSITLTALLGVPIPEYADGTAFVRIYRDDEFVDKVSADIKFTYWTTIYTDESRKPESAGIARFMALREAADKAAEKLCGLPDL